MTHQWDPLVEESFSAAVEQINRERNGQHNNYFTYLYLDL